MHQRTGGDGGMLQLLLGLELGKHMNDLVMTHFHRLVTEENGDSGPHSNQRGVLAHARPSILTTALLGHTLTHAQQQGQPTHHFHGRLTLPPRRVLGTTVDVEVVLFQQVLNEVRLTAATSAVQGVHAVPVKLVQVHVVPVQDAGDGEVSW